MKTVKGEFAVKPEALPQDEVSKALGLMRMKFEKQFEGALKAEGLVTMTGLLDKSAGSGGYVAIERVAGSLEGKKGSFFLQHSCTMDRGAEAQAIRVIPGSGQGELEGLSGRMTIEIKEGKHFYTFEYEL